MSTKLLALASDLADVNPAGSQLIVNLLKAESGIEFMNALDAYDEEVENSESEDDYEVYNVYEEDEDYVEEVEDESEVNIQYEDNLVTV